MSNIFIQLVHCPWLLPYLIVSVISLLGLPWYYPHYLFQPYFPRIISILHYHKGSLLWMGFYFYINYIIDFYSIILWFRDSIREYTSTYKSLIIMLSIAFYVLILSESMFFITFFWSSFHASCSSVWSLEGLYLSDPSELAFINTVLLSNSGLSLDVL